MKYPIMAAVMAALAFAPPALAAAGTTAPTFKLKTLEGKPFDSASLKDKRAALMVFWASW